MLPSQRRNFPTVCNIRDIKTGDDEKNMVSLPSAESAAMDRISDDDDDDSTGVSDAYDEDLITAAMGDDVTAQLAAAGWQIKYINGDFHFFGFAFRSLVHLLIRFFYKSTVQDYIAVLGTLWVLVVNKITEKIV